MSRHILTLKLVRTERLLIADGVRVLSKTRGSSSNDHTAGLTAMWVAGPANSIRRQFCCLLRNVFLGPFIIAAGFARFGTFSGFHLLDQVHVR